MKRLALFILMIMVFCTAAYSEESVDSLTYAVYPYLPDSGYYQELIEARWAEVEPDIKLVRAEWNCYHDGAPEGIDVIMYDAVLRDKLITAGWIQPVDPNSIQNPEVISAFIGIQHSPVHEILQEFFGTEVLFQSNK